MKYYQGPDPELLLAPEHVMDKQRNGFEDTLGRRPTDECLCDNVADT